MKVWFGPALLSLMAATTVVATAQSLAQRDMIAHDKTDLATYAKQLNTSCASHIRVAIDYKSFGTAPGGINMVSHAPNLLAENAGDAIQNVCKTPDGKSAVQQKIKVFVTKYGTAEAESLSNGVFTFTTTYGPMNTNVAEAYLKANL